MRLLISILMVPTLAWSQLATDVVERSDRAAFGVLVGGDLTGSGILIDSSGLALTAAHQIVQRQGALMAQSRHFGQREFTVLATDLGSDLALLQLAPQKAPYAHVSIANDLPTAGTALYLLGSPIYRHNLFLSGSVARNQPGFEYFPSRKHYVRVIYLSGPSPSGTSGGAWLSDRGELVGLQVGMMHTGTAAVHAPVGIAYMAPTDAIRTLVKRRRSVRRPSLMIGIEEFWEQSPEDRQPFGQTTGGLMVAKLIPGSPASTAGMVVGDLITAIEDQPIIYRDRFLDLVRQKKPGEGVRLHITSPMGKKKIISVTLTPL